MSRSQASSRRHLALPALLAVVLVTCSGESPVAPDRTVGVPDELPAANGTVAFVDVRVVPLDREVVLAGHTVVVRGDRIVAVGPADRTPVPEEATVVEGRGRWLMPGLADAHVHMSAADAPAYVAHGVTTVRNMWGWPGLHEIRRRIEEGELVGPSIVSYGPGLDAPPAYWPFTRIVTDPDAARAAVREHVAEGWLGIKVYRDLSAEVYEAIAEETAAAGVPFVGHVPLQVGLDAALAAGQRSLEHLLGYSQALTGSYGAWSGGFDEDGFRALARRTAEAGAWNCPTLEILRRGGRPGHGNRLEAVRVLREEGAELLVGTDSGIEVTEPGRSIRDELALFVAAGATPYEALRDATVDVARFLGMEGEFGVVAEGARADLLLLDRNPMESVAHLGALDGVMLRGAWIPGR